MGIRLIVGDTYYNDLTYTIRYYTRREQEAELCAEWMTCWRSSNGGKLDYRNSTDLRSISSSSDYDYEHLGDSTYDCSIPPMRVVNGRPWCQGYAISVRMCWYAGWTAASSPARVQFPGNTEDHAWNT
jgi:hypothetical protein